ncbi:hypothetical protein BDV98DRAFT_585345 [Pterulicium gracile]|uniref:Uncharacterized protein n=1 Tax=Pterulicium gracile TaxID=1884261 RepID=A0A5C3Q7R0_9AGAR|nr:hypothetical protein BDV98DRAFT_585345 [Pterula gracilis]
MNFLVDQKLLVNKPYDNTTTLKSQKNYIRYGGAWVDNPGEDDWDWVDHASCWLYRLTELLTIERTARIWRYTSPAGIGISVGLRVYKIIQHSRNCASEDIDLEFVPVMVDGRSPEYSITSDYPGRRSLVGRERRKTDYSYETTVFIMDLAPGGDKDHIYRLDQIRPQIRDDAAISFYFALPQPSFETSINQDSNRLLVLGSSIIDSTSISYAGEGWLDRDLDKGSVLEVAMSAGFLDFRGLETQRFKSIKIPGEPFEFTFIVLEGTSTMARQVYSQIYQTDRRFYEFDPNKQLSNPIDGNFTLLGFIYSPSFATLEEDAADIVFARAQILLLVRVTVQYLKRYEVQVVEASTRQNRSNYLYIEPDGAVDETRSQSQSENQEAHVVRRASNSGSVPSMTPEPLEIRGVLRDLVERMNAIERPPPYVDGQEGESRPHAHAILTSLLIRSSSEMVVESKGDAVS